MREDVQAATDLGVNAMIETMPAQLDNQIYRHVSECTGNDRLLAIAV